MASRGVFRERVGTVLVVLLVVLAGCVGGGGTGGEATESVDDDIDGSATPDGSSTAGGSDGSVGTGDGSSNGDDDEESTGGTTEGDAAEFEAAYEEYVSNLDRFENYTVAYEWSAEGGEVGTNGSFEGLVRVDRETESAYMVQTVPGGSNRTVTAELFWPESGETVYTRYDAGGSVHYRTSPREESMLTLWTDPGLGTGSVPSTGASTGPTSLGGFSYVGIVSTADGPRHRYVIDDRTTARLENASDGTVTDYYVEVLVDEERGIITDYRTRMTYNGSSETGPRSFEFELSYRDVGSTTVAAPEWLSEAKAQTG